MDLDHEVEIFGFHLGKALVPQDAGVVDRDVDAAPFFLRLGDHFDHLIIFGDRRAIGHRGAAGGFDFLDHFQGRIRMAGSVARRAQIVDHHPGPAPGQFQRIFAAQPAPGTGHDGDAARKRNRHGNSPENRAFGARIVMAGWHFHRVLSSVPARSADAVTAGLHGIDRSKRKLDCGKFRRPAEGGQLRVL